MGHGVHGHDRPLLRDGADVVRAVGRFVPNDEERGLYALVVQDLQDVLRIPGGAVVKGQVDVFLALAAVGLLHLRRLGRGRRRGRRRGGRRGHGRGRRRGCGRRRGHGLEGHDRFPALVPLRAPQDDDVAGGVPLRADVGRGAARQGHQNHRQEQYPKQHFPHNLSILPRSSTVYRKYPAALKIAQRQGKI